MEQKTITLSDYIDIVKRRKWVLFFPTFITGVAACIMALVLPPVYKSTSTILIEDQEIPEDYVTSSVSTYAEKRIENIKQRIMSRVQLIEIIERLGLYQAMRQERTMGAVVAKMREDISIVPTSAEVVDRRTGRSKLATISFTITYEGEDSPESIQKATTILTTLFLQENVKVRERNARETSSFLEEEKSRLQQYLNRIDSQIASFKEIHLHELPEVLSANVQAVGEIERSIELLNEKLRNLTAKEGNLAVEITGLVSEEESEEQRRLDELKVQLTRLRAIYSDRYPDVIKVKSEIEELKKRMAGTRQGGRKNASYVVLASQRNSIQNDIKSVKIQLVELEKQKRIYQRRIQATPRVEEEYLALVSERRSIQKKYDDMIMKTMEAKVAQGLEKEQKGEKFILVDPARIPEEPHKPNRLAVVLIGVILGIGSGIGLVALMELSDHSVRTPEDLVRLSAYPVLSEIPVILSPMDIKRIRNRKWILVNGSMAVILIVIGAFSYFFVDFAGLWTAVVTKFHV